MKPVFGIVGCGSIARFHFNGLAKAGARVAHVADLNEAVAQPYAERFGARLSKDYRAVIADPEITAVSVLTSSRFHHEICRAALAAGKDVICEKTMMDNAREAEDTVRAVAASGRLFFTAFMKRFFPAARKAKELVPQLGRVFSATVRSFQPWGDLYTLTSDKGYEWILANYGGAVLKCAGSHMLDLAMFLLGRPESLYAHLDFLPGSRLDRKAVAVLQYPGGMTATFEAAVHPLQKIGPARDAWDEGIEINGVHGRLTLRTVMWDQPERNAASLVHYDNATGSATEHRFDIVNPFDEEMKYFAECLEKRVPGRPGVVDGFHVDAVIEAMMQSAEQRSAITLDWKGIAE
ncbi:MAG: Gfo/Idh/MocA family oxidoreductase [Verrucomicrobia bacterium]|jgi:predicted dehydrogenase|nr:Gfo/Idh/MocA family oxidoreductase [Verrucomicrobiota bacterium]